MKAALWIAVAIVAAGSALLFVHLSTTDLEYSRFNPGWNGTSRFFGAFSAKGGTEVAEPAVFGMEGGALLIVIAPVADVAPYQGDALRSFVARGNTLLLADETGEGNGMLEAIGSSIRVDGRPLASIDMEYDTPASVVAHADRADPLLANVSSVALNAPSLVTGGEPLLSTSPLSWIDANHDLRANADEPMSSAVVLARERVGAGTVYVLADPSIFTNAMIGSGRRDNALFLDNLLGWSPGLGAETTASRTAGADGVLLALNAAKNTTIIKIGLLIFVLAAVAFTAGRSGRRA